MSSFTPQELAQLDRQVERRQAAEEYRRRHPEDSSPESLLERAHREAQAARFAS